MPRLLLLEDDLSLIDSLAYSLTKQGYKVDVGVHVRSIHSWRMEVVAMMLPKVTTNRCVQIGSKTKRYRLLCPKCGYRIIDQEVGVTSELHLVQEEEWQADYYLKCQKCKSEIGLRKTTEYSPCSEHAANVM